MAQGGLESARDSLHAKAARERREASKLSGPDPFREGLEEHVRRTTIDGVLGNEDDPDGAPAGGFGGGPQGVDVPAGPNLTDEIRRAAGLG
jgi:hypothetical protein